jgi:hypothetical protein
MNIKKQQAKAFRHILPNKMVASVVHCCVFYLNRIIIVGLIVFKEITGMVKNICINFMN